MNESKDGCKVENRDEIEKKTTYCIFALQNFNFNFYTRRCFLSGVELNSDITDIIMLHSKVSQYLDTGFTFRVAYAFPVIQ